MVEIDRLESGHCRKAADIQCASNLYKKNLNNRIERAAFLQGLGTHPWSTLKWGIPPRVSDPNKLYKRCLQTRRWQDSRQHQLGASTQLCKQKTWIWDSVLLVASYTAFKKLYCLLTIVLLPVKVSHRHNHGLRSVLPKTLRLPWRHGEPKALRVALCSWTRGRRSTV